MRKLLIVTAVFLLSSSAIFAQFTKGKSSFGVKTGINLSSLREGVSYSNYEPKVKIGFVVGAVTEIPVAKRFTLQGEFLYSQLGTRAFDGINNAGNITLRYNYFSIPVLMKFKICKNFAAIAGVENNFRIRARREDDQDHTVDITNDIKDFDFAATAGFEFWFNNNIVGQARYIHGTQDVSPTPNNSSLYNQAAQVTFGYRFVKMPKKPKAGK